MNSKHYDNPEVEARWFREQRKIVREYLDKQEVRTGELDQKPAWFVAPYVAIWKATRLGSGKQNDVWVISGDLPTDYFELNTGHPREVLMAFSKRWKEMSGFMIKGQYPPDVQIGKLDDQKMLGDLLEKRSQILSDWSKDDTLWQ